MSEKNSGKTQDEKFKIKKSQLKYIFVFLVIAVISATLLYFFLPEILKYKPKPNEWVHSSGFIFAFRQDLVQADQIFVTDADCNNINTAFNGFWVQNVTIYAKNDESDFALHNLEITEIAIKLTNYYRLERQKVGIHSNIWKIDDPPIGSPSHPRIYLIGPASATNSSISFSNNVVFVSGVTQNDFDLAVIKSMMCAFGIKV